MKKIITAIILCHVVFSGLAQNKTAAHYWGRVPSFPNKASAEIFRSFIEECEVLKNEIREEAEKQDELIKQKVSTVNPASMQMPQNMSPAEIQKSMKRTQDRVDFANEMTATFTQLQQEFETMMGDFENDYASAVYPLKVKAAKLCPDGAMGAGDEARLPACNAARKELEAAETSFLNKHFLNGATAFKAWLAKYAAAKKSYEQKIVEMRDDSFIGTGISVKGLPCSEPIRGISEYLTYMQQIFQKAIDNGLLH